MNDTNPQTIMAWMQATPFRKNITILIFTFIALALIAKTVLLFKEADNVGQGDNYPQSVTVVGKADVYAQPDTLQFNINVNEDGKDAGEAVKKATEKINKATEILKANGVDPKNIKTTNFSINDRYENVNVPCDTVKAVTPNMAPAAVSGPSREIYYVSAPTVTPCVNTTTKIVGSTVYQTLEVKIQDIAVNATEEKRGKMVSDLAAANIKIDNIAFTVFDLDSVKAEARAEAIVKAKADARVLSRNLGVSLTKIIGFSENQDGAYPYMSARAESAMAGADKAMGMPTAALPSGQQKVTSSVSITYLLK
mgnify:CR=1 FL=1